MSARHDRRRIEAWLKRLRKVGPHSLAARAVYNEARAARLFDALVTAAGRDVQRLEGEVNALEAELRERAG